MIWRKQIEAKVRERAGTHSRRDRRIVELMVWHIDRSVPSSGETGHRDLLAQTVQDKTELLAFAEFLEKLDQAGSAS